MCYSNDCQEKIPEIFLDSSMVEHSAVNRRVVGSNPTRGVLKSVSQLLADFNFEKINIWLRGQAVKTSPFHGGNTSSNLVGVTPGIFSVPVHTIEYGAIAKR